MAQNIRNIETGVDTSDATALASDILIGKLHIKMVLRELVQ